MPRFANMATAKAGYQKTPAGDGDYIVAFDRLDYKKPEGKVLHPLVIVGYKVVEVVEEFKNDEYIVKCSDDVSRTFRRTPSNIRGEAPAQIIAMHPQMIDRATGDVKAILRVMADAVGEYDTGVVGPDGPLSLSDMLDDPEHADAATDLFFDAAWFDKNVKGKEAGLSVRSGTYTTKKSPLGPPFPQFQWTGI